MRHDIKLNTESTNNTEDMVGCRDRTVEMPDKSSSSVSFFCTGATIFSAFSAFSFAGVAAPACDVFFAFEDMA